MKVSEPTALLPVIVQERIAAPSDAFLLTQELGKVVFLPALVTVPGGPHEEKISVQVASTIPIVNLPLICQPHVYNDRSVRGRPSGITIRILTLPMIPNRLHKNTTCRNIPAMTSDLVVPLILEWFVTAD